MRFLYKFITDLFMGPDGKTWALGRVYSIPILISGIGYPALAVWRGQTLDLSNLSVLLAGTAGAVAAMVAVTNHIDNPIPKETK